MQDFTGGGIHALRRGHASSGNPDFDRRIKELVRDWGVRESQDLIAEAIVTALRMGSDAVPVADLKLINRSIKELRQAARAFAPYAGIQKVAVFGSARTPAAAPEAQAAEAFAAAMRDRGFMIITGGGEGIMGAAQRGAGREHSFGLNIRLPFEQRANEIIEGDPKLVNFNYFFTRKVNFVKETHAIALFPGGFGTMDEGFEILTLMQTGKARIIPLVLVDKPGGTYWHTWEAFLREHFLASALISPDDFAFFRRFDRVEDAVEEIVSFYCNFHSYRWVGPDLVIRLSKPLTPAALAKVNAAFQDMFATGALASGPPLPEEQNEPALYRLPRLIGRPYRRNFGRMRSLIDALNRAETVRAED